MRIIAGTFGGRRLRAPRGRRVRPSGDRLREAWFSILQGRLPGARVVDLFAGSGALGLEALSRGAATADFVERGPALRTLAENVRQLDVGAHVTIHRVDALRFVERLPPLAYDLAFADPPYAGGAAARLVALYRAIPFAGVLGVEHRAADAIAGDETRRYGDAAITFCYQP